MYMRFMLLVQPPEHTAHHGALPDSLALALYRAMVLARAADHGSTRRTEAAVLGSAAAMKETDWVFPASYALGASLWPWKPARVISVSLLAGRHIAHAVGMAWAARLRKADGVALVFFDA